MKKTFLLLTMLLILTLALTACNDKPSSNTPNGQTEQPADTANTPVETAPPNNVTLPDAEFIKVFKAPEGDYREIAYSYMLAMANHKWVAGENFKITWKDQGDFGVDLTFKKGETYYGLPYSERRASLEQFSLFCADGAQFKWDTYYYEDVIGNHCSSSMGLAYQQLIDFPYAGTLKPVGARRGVIRLCDGLEQPAGDTTSSWYSEDVIKLNGQAKMYDAYLSMGRGDILAKFQKTSGHSRMVSRVEIFKNAAGKVIPTKCLVYTIEQTNAFDADSDRKTTWWIEHKYTFNDLIDKNFIPLTLEIFHNGEELKDAYIAFDTKNTPETILKAIKGTVSSNFPISYVRATVTDKNGNVVGEIYRNKFDKAYKVNLSTSYSQLNISKLEPGTYTYTLHAGIARGGCDIEKFDFTIS